MKEGTLSSQLDVFPDWFPPALVKELRQGLRTRGFILALVLSHFGMIMALLASFTVESNMEASQMLVQLHYLILCLLMLFAQPLRGLFGVAPEVKDGTLELIRLTRLGARRIAIGKWVSISSQSLLFLVSFLPYMLLRYFLGGVNLAEESAIHLVILLGSGYLTAVALCFSAIRSVIVRIGLLLAAIPTLPALYNCGLMRPLGVGFRGGGISFSSLPELALMTAGLLLGCHLLAGAAGTGIDRIRMREEAFDRLLSLGFILSAGLLGWLASLPLYYVLFLPFQFALGMRLVSGPKDYNPAEVEHFRAFGPFSRPASILLRPGCDSGMLFFLLASICLAATCWWTTGQFAHGLGAVAMASLFAFNQLSVHIIAREKAHRFSHFCGHFLLQFLLVVVFLFLALVGRASDPSGPLALIPSTQLLTIWELEDVRGFAVFIDLVYLIIAFALAGNELSERSSHYRALRGKLAEKHQALPANSPADTIESS